MNTSKNIYCFFIGIVFSGWLICIVACNSNEPNEETLIQYTRASGAYSEGRFVEAAEMLLPLKSFQPAMVLRGKSLYFSDQSVEAEKIFRTVLSLRPSSAEAVIYLVRILKERGALDEAESFVMALISDDPSDIRAFRLAAEISFLKGTSGELQGRAYLEKAVEASTEAALVFLDRARYRWVSGNGDGALADLQAAKVLVPEDSPLFKSISALERTIMEVIE